MYGKWTWLEPLALAAAPERRQGLLQAHLLEGIAHGEISLVQSVALLLVDLLEPQSKRTLQSRKGLSTSSKQRPEIS
ncbi:MAG TPA: hypothetical protein VMV75_10205 [Sulfuricella sp.]|nr:hypothetical protein [Sulfuricella sp.]